jgi:hypothetical protein
MLDDLKVTLSDWLVDGWHSYWMEESASEQESNGLVFPV